MGQDALIIETSRLHWMSDQSNAETPTWQAAHNTHKIQKSIPLAGFEPVIPARERSQTHALDRAATGIGEEHD